MTSRVARWGNSLALRIARSVAAEANIRDGDAVDGSVQDGARWTKAGSASGRCAVSQSPGFKPSPATRHEVTTREQAVRLDCTCRSVCG